MTVANFQKSQLSNGIKIVSEIHPYSLAASIGVWVDVGTRDEGEGLWGITHFLEHLVFKGTKKRSAFDIAQSLESLGGELNAFTSRENTCFHAYVLKDHWKIALEVLSDLVSNMKLTSNNLELERSVVLQEIAMTEDQHEELCYDYYLEKFLPKNALGIPILGKEETISKLNKKTIDEYYTKNYQGSNILISVAGPIEHSDLVRECEKLLGSKKKDTPQKKRVRPKHGSGVHAYDKQSEQIHLLIGFEAATFKDKGRFDAFVLNTLLGGGMTSRLFQSIREKKGLAYSVNSMLNTFTDFGIMNVYAATEPEKMKSLITTIKNEFLRLKSQGVRQKEIDFFKRQLRGSILLGSDDIENRMNSIAVNELVFNSYRPVDDIIFEINEVSKKSIENYLETYFESAKFGAIVIGNQASKFKNMIEDTFEKI